MSNVTQPITFAARCKAATCDRTDIDALGMCHRHYAYFNKHGVCEPPPWVDSPISLTEPEAAWLAAVIDCEGTITMSSGRRAGSRACVPMVCVGNTDIRLILKLESLTGCGKVRFVKTKSPRAKDQWSWAVRRQADVRSILLAIRGHLLLKGQQADILLALPRPNSKAATARNEARDAVKLLNKKGPPSE